MSQQFVTPDQDTELVTDAANIANSLEALRSRFSGTSAPSDPSPVAGQQYQNTSSKLVYGYNGSSWNAQQHSDVRSDRYITTLRLGAVSATTTFALACAKGNLTAERVLVLSMTATTSTGTDHWTVQVSNATASNNLRSAAFDTNGSEFSTTAAKNLALDQNLDIADGDRIHITFTKNGSATSLADVTVQLEAVPR